MAPGLPPIRAAVRQERSDAMRGAASGRRASNQRPSARSRPSRGPAKLALPRYGAESTPPTSAGFGRFRPACVATLLPPVGAGLEEAVVEDEVQMVGLDVVDDHQRRDRRE